MGGLVQHNVRPHNKRPVLGHLSARPRCVQWTLRGAAVLPNLHVLHPLVSDHSVE
jgi:hypothetical protein